VNIYSSYTDGRLRLFLNGELDHHEAKNAYESIDSSIDRYLPRDCVLDFSQLTFMDSSGIALILRVFRKMHDNGGRAWIENACGQPMKVIDASGIERIIKISQVKEAMQ